MFHQAHFSVSNDYFLNLEKNVCLNIFRPSTKDQDSAAQTHGIVGAHPNFVQAQ